LMNDLRPDETALLTESDEKVSGGISQTNPAFNSSLQFMAQPGYIQALQASQLKQDLRTNPDLALYANPALLSLTRNVP
jgi:hypothetical protein